MSLAGRASCAVHPERHGSAACVGCKRIGCVECMTRWEGIHYCTRCLAARRAPRRLSSMTLPWLGWLVVIAAGAAASLVMLPTLLARLVELSR